MKPIMENPVWPENVIIVDADYVDRVAFDLIVNFEMMIGRRIPKADLAHWLDCVALDGGLREGDNQVMVAFVYDRGRQALENFTPADYRSELSGKAFRDNLGEFAVDSYEVGEQTDKASQMLDTLQIVCSQPAVRRVMFVGDHSALHQSLCSLTRNVDDSKRVTVFTMEPRAGGNFRLEILGYSLMSALGIRADEIKPQ